MGAIGASRCELSQFVTHHLVGDKDRDMLSTVVNGDRVANHLGKDGGGPRPSLDDFFFTAGIHSFHLSHEVVSDEWPFFE